MWLEVAFKIVFFLSIIVFCLAIILTFLLFIKFLFLFNPTLTFMGINFSPAGL